MGDIIVLQKSILVFAEGMLDLYMGCQMQVGLFDSVSE